MIFGASSPSSAVHHAPDALAAGTSPISPREAAIAATTPPAPRWSTNGTVKPKWKRALSRIAASPAERSACTENGACT